MTKKAVFNLVSIAVIIYVFCYNAVYINNGTGSQGKVIVLSIIAYVLLLRLMVAAIKASGYSIGLSVVFSAYCIFLMIVICTKTQAFGIFVAPFYLLVFGIYELLGHNNLIIATIAMLIIPIVISVLLSFCKQYKNTIFIKKDELCGKPQNKA